MVVMLTFYLMTTRSKERGFLNRSAGVCIERVTRQNNRRATSSSSPADPIGTHQGRAGIFLGENKKKGLVGTFIDKKTRKGGGEDSVIFSHFDDDLVLSLDNHF